MQPYKVSPKRQLGEKEALMSFQTDDNQAIQLNLKMFTPKHLCSQPVYSINSFSRLVLSFQAKPKQNYAGKNEKGVKKEPWGHYQLLPIHSFNYTLKWQLRNSDVIKNYIHVRLFSRLVLSFQAKPKQKYAGKNEKGVKNEPWGQV